MNPNDTSAVVATSEMILAEHARSFRWAATFLPSSQRKGAAVLYAFCRMADDIADDETRPREGRALELQCLADELEGIRPPCRLVSVLFEQFSEFEIDSEAASHLVESVRGDLQPVFVGTRQDLLSYCYGVAGTVGMMMCGVLGVENSEARHHAISLGIGMQLTNICRDVAEDGAIGRVYLPAEDLSLVGVPLQRVMEGTADRDAVATVVADLLEWADTYYAFADKGMKFIPWRPRLAILAASRIYQAIGHRLLRERQADPFQGRVVVPWYEKVICVLRAFVAWCVSLLWSDGSALVMTSSYELIPAVRDWSRKLNGLPVRNENLADPKDPQRTEDIGCGDPII
jgi:15-cis-phytoene synthase